MAQFYSAAMKCCHALFYMFLMVVEIQHSIQDLDWQLEFSSSFATKKGMVKIKSLPYSFSLGTKLSVVGYVEVD